MQSLNRLFLYLLPLMPFVGYVNSKVTGVYVGYVIGFISVIITIANVMTSKSNLKLPKYLFVYLLFVIYSIFIQYYKSLVVSPIQFFGTNSIVFSFFLLFVIENTVYTEEYIKKYYRFLKITVLFAVLTAIIQLFISKEFFIDIYASGNTSFRFLYSDFGRIPNIQTYSGGMGIFLLTFSSIVIFSYFNQKIYLFRERKIIIVIYLALVGFVIIVGQTRWIMVAYLIVLFQFVIYRKNIFSGFMTNLVYIFLISILIYGSLRLFDYDIDKLLQDRIIQSGKTLEDNTGYSRIKAYTYFSEFFPDNPLLGTGETMSYKIKSAVHTQIHVGWLSAFLYFGLIGGFLFVFSFYLLGKDILKYAKAWNQYFVFFVFMVYVWANFTLVYIHFLEWGFLVALVFYNFQKQRYVMNTLPNVLKV